MIVRALEALSLLQKFHAVCVEGPLSRCQQVGCRKNIQDIEVALGDFFANVMIAYVHMLCAGMKLAILV
jgi:hypothetical protein